MNAPHAGAAPVLLHMDVIEGLAPLDDQFGQDMPKTVPDGLQDVMFGDPDAQAKAPLRSFAVLDAARITNLEELLIHSGLPHRCLFQGAAFDELKSCAPWLVELQDGAAFARHLFTDAGAPWHLWSAEAGVFLRARCDLETLWRHVRKFTRVRDSEDQWFFLRFWEPGPMAAYFQSIAQDGERVSQWFSVAPEVTLDLITLDPKAGVARRFHSAHTAGSNQAFVLDAREWSAFRLYHWNLFLDRLIDHAAEETPGFDRADPAARTRINQFATEAFRHGIKREKAVADFVLACTLTEGGVLGDALCQKILGQDKNQLDKAADVLSEARTRVQKGPR